MNFKYITALIVSALMFVGFVFTVTRGETGFAMMLFGASLAVLMLIKIFADDERKLAELVEKTREHGIQQVQASLIMGSLAKESIEGRIPAGSVAVDAAIDQKEVVAGVIGIAIKLRANALTPEGEKILSEIYRKVKLPASTPAKGYADKETSEIKAFR